PESSSDIRSISPAWTGAPVALAPVPRRRPRSLSFKLSCVSSVSQAAVASSPTSETGTAPAGAAGVCGATGLGGAVLDAGVGGIDGSGVFFVWPDTTGGGSTGEAGAGGSG